MDVRTIYRYHAKNASPVKWLCCDLPASTDQRARGTFVQTFWVQSNTFAGWALTEGQHQLKAGKKKKTHEAGLFFLVPASTRCSIRKGVNPASAMSS